MLNIKHIYLYFESFFLVREATICESVKEEAVVGGMKKQPHIKRGRLPRGLCPELRHSEHRELRS